MAKTPTGESRRSRPETPQSSLLIVLLVLLMSGGVPADVAACVSDTLPLLVAST
ncbi:hypothetical protein GJV82_13070 [Cellulosimicrobium sp. BIT-GX5]|uniref:Uncharacterized protein n=1 Tax=Cellulosimicrobium composti TaxID=2672572 RepID=A0A6N7ZKU6_9MICO|nr:hypothetical protein [Cellulosimicrobium composti]MTG89869.1 hypothetical protein [Cellulosimicrobium composti]